jgi:hypothetical protein
VLLLVGLACLFPVTLYCLFLAMVHQRRTPTMISGVWDFVGIMLALSGFLLIGTTVFLMSLNPGARSFFLDGGPITDLMRAYARSNRYMFLLWALFFLTLGSSFAFVLWQRRAFTVLYHVTPNELEQLLSNVLFRLRLSATNRGPRWFIGYDQPAMAPAIPEDSEKELLVEFDQVRKAIIDVEGSSTLRYVTMNWRFVTAAMRREIEYELARDLANFAASEGSVASWLMTATTSAFVLMVFMLVTFLILSFR